MAVKYEDERLEEVKNEQKAALNEVEQAYSSAIDKTDSFFQDQINASKQWADQQSQLTQQQTDFALGQIEQQKEQAQKDYTKEQSAAYVDWQKQSDKYGANAEQAAQAGMTNTGFSETSQVAMYNQYQNRVAVAREAVSKAILNYDNGIKEAQLQNSAMKAQIAFEALQQQLSLALEGFQYRNNLIMESVSQKNAVKNQYFGNYLSVLDQINKEKAFAEEQRQFDESLAEEKRQFDESMKRQTSGGEIYDFTDGTSGDGSGTQENNMDSINALGYGSITAEELAKLISAGMVEREWKNGQWYYRKTNLGKKMDAASFYTGIKNPK